MANYAVPAPDDAPTGGYAVPAPDDPGGQSGASGGWQSQVKPTQTYNGKQSVQRSDGAVWYGPEQGNTGQVGWFDAKGNRAGDAPGQAYSAGVGRTAGNTGLAAMAGFGSPLEAGIRAYGNLGGALREGTGFDLPWSQEASNFAQDQARYRQGLTQGGHGFPEAGNALGTMASQIGLANALPTAGLASRAGNYAAPATSALGRIGQAAGAGEAAAVPYGVQAALTTPPDQGVSYPQHMAGNLQGAMEMGAAIPGGLSAMGEGIEGAGQGIRRALGSPAERQAALDLAAKIRTTTGAEPSLGESLQNPNLQHVENATEYVPFSGRGNQLKSANTAMQSALQAETDAHASAIGPTGAGDVISNSAKAELAAKRAPAIALYNEVRDTIGNITDTTGKPFPPTVDNTLKAYDDAIAQESGITGKDSKQTQLLQGERDKLASGETAPDYKSLEKMQDRQQSIAANGFNAPSQEAQDVAHYRAGIGKAMGSDLQATANAVDPALGDKYKQGNKIYSESYAYDPNASTDWQGAQQRSMNRTIHGAEGTIQSLPDNLLKSNNPDVATHAFDALDDTGKNAVKAEIWNRINQAANPVEAGGKSKGQVFSPLKASSAIDAHSNFINQFFNPQEQDQIYGMRDAFRKMARAGQYMEGISTGKFVPAMAGISGAGTAATLLATGHPGLAAMETLPIAAARGYNALSGSPAGKAWMLKPTPSSSGLSIPPAQLGSVGAIVGSQIHQPTSQEEYDAIPSGEPYQSISGAKGVKP